MQTQQLQQLHHATIEATGRGMSTARPDVAILRLGVVTQAKEPKDASEQNAKTMTNVIAALRQLKIPESSIQTTGLNLQPLYEWDEANKRNVLVGYRAENTVTVKTPIDRAGEVYDAGIDAGANEGGGIVLTLEDDTKIRRDTLALATKLAVEEIQTVAKALGVQLIGPIHAQVIENGGPRPFELGLRKADVGTPVMPGLVEVVENVRVVFEIKHP